MVDFNFMNNVPPPIHLGCVPSYNKPEDDLLLQAMIDKLEDMEVVRKASELNIIPKYASPCMMVKKQSIRDLKPGVYENLSIYEKLRFNRFVLCLNKLNQYVENRGDHKYCWQI